MTASILLASGEHQSGWIYLAIFGGLAAMILVLWAVNKVITHFFPSSRKVYSAGGNALMRIEGIFLPGREHVIEAIEREDAEQDDEGDPPEAGRH